MSFVRQFLAVFLSMFLALPAVAAEKNTKKVGDKEYPYFKIGIRPVDDSGFVNWDFECTVISNEDSVPVRLEYKSKVDGKIKVSIFGIIRPGEEIVVDKLTKTALRVRRCGNGIVQPTDWVPTGELRCVSPRMAPAEILPTVEPIPAPEPVKPLRLDVLQPVPEPAPALPKMVEKPKKKTWLYILGGAILGGAIVAFAGGGGGSKSSGGPAKDPPN